MKPSLGYWLGWQIAMLIPESVIEWWAKKQKFLLQCPICNTKSTQKLTSIRPYCQCGTYMQVIDMIKPKLKILSFFERR